MRPVPIMFVSDDPSTVTGLGRITRDLARLVASSPRWRVATLGLGGAGSRHFPWTHYHMHRWPTGAYEYGELSLCAAWDDFTLGTDGAGVVMTIFDVTRMLWLARPEHLNDPEMKANVQRLRQKVTLWGYFMQDHEGPQGALTQLSREVLLGYDRILMTSPFGCDVVRATIGHEESDKRGLTWMPHGIWMDVFAPTPTTGSGDDADAVDPTQQLVATLDRTENVQAAVADVMRLRDEGKI